MAVITEREGGERGGKKRYVIKKIGICINECLWVIYERVEIKTTMGVEEVREGRTKGPFFFLGGDLRVQ